jgi:quinol monooxygenase YgiN
MVTELAIFTAAEGKAEELGPAILKGLDVIRQQAGCVSARVERCVEYPEQFALFVVWSSLDAHLKGFREGPFFPQWRAHIAGLFAGQPVVCHYQQLEKE